MKLEEAIKRCEELADSKYNTYSRECRQLAEWLKKLKQYILECKKGSGIKCWILFAVFLLAFSLDLFCLMMKLTLDERK